MLVVRPLVLVFCLFALVTAAPAQTADQPPAKIDFARDVQPLLATECLGCHGPKRQIAGLRLDQKSSVMKAQSRRIIPGNTENSLIYHRVSDNLFGPMMPPTGELKPAQVAIIHDWIQQGAVWPDALSVETPLPPIDPQAVALVDLLHRGDIPSFLKQVNARPALLNARGPDSATPFMFAVLYVPAATLEQLLVLGADPNHATDDHATPLMWAASDLARTKVLVAHGANVNAESDKGRTPLMIAARHPGGAPTVQFLLEHGANPNPHARTGNPASPLVEALIASDPQTFDILIAHGADPKTTGPFAIDFAIENHCKHCLDVLVASITNKRVYTGALQDIALFGDLSATQLLIDHGADVNAPDGLGRTALMYAVVSDLDPVDEVKLLIAHGADVNAVDTHKLSADSGLSVLDIASRHGDTPIVHLLLAAGAKPGATRSAASANLVTFRPATTATAIPVALTSKEKSELRASITSALPLLQHADQTFSTKSGCISCHSNNLNGMAVAMARKRGLPVDETIAAAQVKVNGEALVGIGAELHQAAIIPIGDNFGENIFGFMLMALDAEHYPSDLGTDAAAQFILARQSPNGEWAYPAADQRPPICLNHIGNTVLAMRALQLYPPRTSAAEAKDAIARAATWIASATSYSNDDLGWKLAGLAWAGTNQPALLATRKQLLATQKADGSWADLASMPGSAYATGKNLVALQLSGLPVASPAYQRGVQWLLKTQLKDGTWLVQSRALGFQPAFDGEFPHGHDQWASSAGSSWAVMALSLALPAEPAKLASVQPARQSSPSAAQ